jgi:hypothetical protein
MRERCACERAREVVAARLRRDCDDDERVVVGERAARERLCVAAQFLPQPFVVFACAVELEQEAGRLSAGERQPPVAVGGDRAVEQHGAAALAPPVGEAAASGGGLFAEPGEELVHVELVGELLGAGDGDRSLVAPAQLRPVDVEAGGDDVGAGLVQDPVVGRRALTWLPVRSEAVEHAQSVELVEPVAAATARAEVEAAQLFGGEDAVLVAGECDQPVALDEMRGERGDSRRADAHRPTLLHGHDHLPPCRALLAAGKARDVHALSSVQGRPVRTGRQNGRRIGRRIGRQKSAMFTAASVVASVSVA